MPFWAPASSTTAQAMTSTTTVRRAVARVESVSRMPHLASTEDAPAHSAEPKAHRAHMQKTSFPLFQRSAAAKGAARRANQFAGTSKPSRMASTMAAASLAVSKPVRLAPARSPCTRA